MFNQDDLNLLYRYCYNLTLDEADAYDLLQKALEKFLQSQTHKNNHRAFIYRIIRNQFIDDGRKQKNHQTVQFEEQAYLDIDIKTLESIIIDEDLIDQLLAYLEPLEREIIYYWALEGYTTQQIAKLLEMPKGTVLSKIYRMRQRIKHQFNDELNSPSAVLNEGTKR